MRVLLLTPPEVLGPKQGKVKIGKSASPPLGVGYIAAVLEKGGHRVDFIDLAAQRITNIETILSRVVNYQPDLLGISFTTIMANQAFEIARALKKKLNLPIILGGPHPTYFAEDTLNRLPEADAVVIGEGEPVVLALAEALFAHQPLDNIPGICYRNQQGAIITNQSRKVIDQLDQIPPPARHIFNFKLYAPYPFQTKRRPVATMITSRGCHYAKCTFCYSSVGKTLMHYRRHSVARVIREIKFLIEECGVKEINFLDDDFTAGKSWVNNFCQVLLREKINISWICMARASSVSLEMLENMARAGCWNIFFGIESANQHLLDRIKKGITVGQNRDAVRWAHQAGIQVSAAFMMLLPGEVPADAVRNVQFAKELDIEYVAFGPTRPLVGTPLFEQCAGSAKEKIPPECYRRSGNYFIPYVTFIPQGYTKDQALAVCAKAYREYYLRPRYAWKMLKQIRTFGDVKRYVDCAMLYLRLT